MKKILYVLILSTFILSFYGCARTYFYPMWVMSITENARFDCAKVYDQKICAPYLSCLDGKFNNDRKLKRQSFETAFMRIEPETLEKRKIKNISQLHTLFYPEQYPEIYKQYEFKEGDTEFRPSPKQLYQQRLYIVGHMKTCATANNIDLSRIYKE